MLEIYLLAELTPLKICGPQRCLRALYSLAWGPNISRGVQIFLKYTDWGVQIFRNIRTGGNKKGGVQICRDSSSLLHTKIKDNLE